MKQIHLKTDFYFYFCFYFTVLAEVSVVVALDVGIRLLNHLIIKIYNYY